jgi:hypothetical protein
MPAVAEPERDLLSEVDRRLARHAVEDVSPGDGLLLAIETLVEVGVQQSRRSADSRLSAADLARFDEALLTPLIRRGQAQGIWPSGLSAASLALSLRSLIAGLLPVARLSQQGASIVARNVHTLFCEAAANAAC